LARGDEPGRVDDIFGEADAFLYWQPRGSEGNTLLFRLSATGGWSVQTPFQLTLGGRQAVRGYADTAFPGGRRLVMSVEERTYFPWPAPELFDFGLSMFMDLGHIQPGGVPFGVDSGWRAAFGVGIRFGLPPGTGNMTRIDLAAPVGPGAQLKDVILRISLQEILGLLPGFRDDQLVRSLRNGVRPTLVSLPW
jgi:hemolysin activation/secretion protein